MKISEKLNKSPISYFSDLFVVVMVLGWTAALFIMLLFACYATLAFENVELWQYVTEAVTIPLSAGGAIWMLKNSVQHAIANYNGTRAHEDFPAVNTSEEIDGLEEPLAVSNTDDTVEETDSEDLG